MDSDTRQRWSLSRATASCLQAVLSSETDGGDVGVGQKVNIVFPEAGTL